MFDRWLFAVALVLITSSACADDLRMPTAKRPDRADNAAMHGWCGAYHDYLTRFCDRMGGDSTICRDASMRFLMVQNGGPKVGCRSMPKNQVQSCIANDTFYLAYCPVVDSKRVPAGVTFRNMDLPSANQLLRQQKMSHSVDNRHVLLIGLDGARPDAVRKAYQELKQQHRLQSLTAFIDRYKIDTNYYAGGDKNTPTQQPTVSAPGWTTILTGVRANQSDIKKNGDLLLGKYNHRIPTIYNRIKQQSSQFLTASYSDWRPLSLLASYPFKNTSGADINQLFLPRGFNGVELADKNMTQQIVRVLNAKNPPQFIYIHYGDPDTTGHLKRFSAKSRSYVNAIKREFVNANRLIERLDWKKHQSWLVIITTDHGGHQFMHGTQNASDRNIFGIVGAIHGPFNRVEGSKKEGQTVFMPIILNYLSPH